MSYNDAVRQATIDQGLDLPILVLNAAGLPAEAFQSGGFCIIATVRALDGGWVGITASEEAEGRFLVCAYLSDDDEGDVVVPDAELGHLADYVRGFITRHGGAAVTVETYAHALATELLKAQAEEPKRYRDVRTWEDLHAVADANDFIQAADDALGTEPASYVDPAYVTLTTSAIDAVEAWIAAPKYAVEVLTHVNETRIVFADDVEDAYLMGEEEARAAHPNANLIEALDVVELWRTRCDHCGAPADPDLADTRGIRRHPACDTEVKASNAALRAHGSNA